MDDRLKTNVTFKLAQICGDIDSTAGNLWMFGETNNLQEELTPFRKELECVSIDIEKMCKEWDHYFSEQGLREGREI